ncbi:MAG TPA: class I SAM-dependent methyltransferase [Casimicrobiaceae bacterium]|nr:class I SAM-dependent methyltransferase [Casimicrobiaceae bacterium]
MNIYQTQLRSDEIDALAHREMVGGLWDEIGQLQFDFMRARGLLPGDRLLDVGCGALRGGVHFVRYLDPGRYCGLDLNASLIEAGKRELAAAGLDGRGASLLVDDAFDVSRFGCRFEWALAVSVFTHLPMNQIVRCLAEVKKVLAPGGRLFASYFEAPASAHLAPLRHPPADIVTRYDADPYHQSADELAALAHFAGMTMERIGAWNHPRGQRMLAFAAG